jgi:FixJ family two-component response regulator
MDPKKLLKGKKILIVDDEPDVLESLIELLDMCRVDAASSFEEGKRLLEDKSYAIGCNRKFLTEII